MSQIDRSPWPVKDVSLDLFIRRLSISPLVGSSANITQIVYTSIIGSVMAMAFLEWFLWLGAFLYCLVKVYQKAEHWSVAVLAVVVGIVFTLLRYAFPETFFGLS
jgi:chitin synthase